MHWHHTPRCCSTSTLQGSITTKRAMSTTGLVAERHSHGCWHRRHCLHDGRIAIQHNSRAVALRRRMKFSKASRKLSLVVWDETLYAVAGRLLPALCILADWCCRPSQHREPSTGLLAVRLLRSRVTDQDRRLHWTPGAVIEKARHLSVPAARYRCSDDLQEAADISSFGPFSGLPMR